MARSHSFTLPVIQTQTLLSWYRIHRHQASAIIPVPVVYAYDMIRHVCKSGRKVMMRTTKSFCVFTDRCEPSLKFERLKLPAPIRFSALLRHNGAWPSLGCDNKRCTGICHCCLVALSQHNNSRQLVLDEGVRVLLRVVAHALQRSP